ncbi:MAG: CoA pyrophosphatase [Candidatus Bathyarchaeota archaeon]|nr:CoA pyrophosphatase [Candidatus Bathyarchaeota archaeon]
MLNAQVVEELSKVLKPFAGNQDASAAVALMIKPTKEDLEFLLVKRVQNPHDPWSGHMALPGGKRDLNDADLLETVVRETFEETGIDLRGGRLLGVCSVVCSERRPDMWVLPFVFLVKGEPQVKLSRGELETFVWASCGRLEESRGTACVGAREVCAFVLGENVVWGLTYRILDEFIQTIKRLLKTQKL